MKGVHSTLTVTAAILGTGAALAGTWSATPYAQLAKEIDEAQDHISAVETAEMLMRGNSQVLIFDLRSAAEFEQFHIPGAVRSTVGNLLNAPVSHDAPIVIYSAGGAHAAQAWTLLRLKGYRKVFFLREGIYEWQATVLNPQLAEDSTPKEQAAFERAKVLSRFFGGSATTNVLRADLRRGYWTGTPNDGASASQVANAKSDVPSRRRGC